MAVTPVASTPKETKLLMTNPSAFSARIVQETSSSGKFFANTARANKAIHMACLSCSRPVRAVKSSGNDGIEDDPVRRRMKSSLTEKLPPHRLASAIDSTVGVALFIDEPKSSSD